MLGFSGIRGRNPLPRKPVISLAFQRRTIVGIVSRLASRFLRLRYIVLGAGVGGTYTVAQKYDEIKTSLPDFSFISDHFPSREDFESAVSNVKHSTEHLSELRKNYFERWKSTLSALVQSEKMVTDDHSGLVSASEPPDVDGEQKVGKRKKDGIKIVTVEELQEALFKRELEFNKRVEQLLQENRELRSELLLRAHRPTQRGRIKRSLIDMYSEVLDELSDLDSAYNAQDQLPRVVVVGDQSAGKTSVLEMIAQARIFPRGSGEMMTRSPVKVTLSEGPYHVASFKDSPRSKDECIESIKEYEEDFFRNSRLFREGTLRLSQMTTANLSKAVSECFWKMVKDSVEQQADTYRALRYNLEAEWKNSFPHLREMDREELFEKARTEILDDLVTLNGISAATWESSLRMQLWNDLAEHVFTEIFEPAQQLDDLGAFQTNIDIWLRDWVEKDLPNTAVKVGWKTLYSQLDDKLSSVQHSPGHEKIFDQLKKTVLQETRNRHTWDHKAENRLRVIQSNALDDRTVHDKAHWTSAVEFLERALKTRLKSVKQSISDLCGPDRLTRWIKWQNLSPEQRQRREVVQEISTLLASYTKPSSKITPDDLTTIRRNLQTRNIEVTDQLISETWEPLVRHLYLERALENAHDCRKSFYYYQQGFLNSSNVHSDSEAAHLSAQAESDLQASLMGAGDPSSHLMTEYSDCREVVFFYRLMRMLEATGNALRQQIMNDEARRLEYHVKQMLSELSDDPIALRKLITGRRVTLAEELKRVRHLQEKLEEFISALNKDD
ncbi:hypothetical protein CRM22_009550 [Opisthorchis felineus]|uniref:dynamin GTPase n=1 Tax=Opisthorchis felineus TaxID=147828 RepID=A0A4S2L762_OPIFE|nr:hypothetical protein CRM22_009550 [Opisthorchis felineus]